MLNILQPILEEYIQTFPGPDDKPEIALTVGTHDPNRDTSKFRLSDAGKCRLMRYNKRHGLPSANSLQPSVLLQMQIGNMFHAYIEHACKDMGVLIASEERLETPDFIGHFDLMLRTRSDTFLYDIKTINNKAAYYMVHDKFQAKPEQHIAQIVSYYMAIDAAYRDGISNLCPPDRLAVAYIVRDTFDMREVEIHLSDHLSRVNDDWGILLRAWKQQTPPEANPAKRECKYCMYAHSCEFAG
jgi:hypothetical protein